MASLFPNLPARWTAVCPVTFVSGQVALLQPKGEGGGDRKECSGEPSVFTLFDFGTLK